MNFNQFMNAPIEKDKNSWLIFDEVDQILSESPAIFVPTNDVTKKICKHKPHFID